MKTAMRKVKRLPDHCKRPVMRLYLRHDGIVEAHFHCPDWRRAWPEGRNLEKRTGITATPVEVFIEKDFDRLRAPGPDQRLFTANELQQNDARVIRG